MSWAKRDLIIQAFDEIGLSNYVFNLRPEQMQAAKRRLDTMMASWNSRGIRIGYALASSPTSDDLDDDSGIPDEAVEAVSINLACRIAPSYGKTVQRETAVAAKQAFDALLSKAQSGEVIEKQLTSNLPMGAGNRRYRNRIFNNPPIDPLNAGPDGIIEF